MKRLVLLALLAGCRNDAITFAKMLDPKASCNATNTDPLSHMPHTAVCRMGSKIYACSADGPDCKFMRDALLEVAP